MSGNGPILLGAAAVAIAAASAKAAGPAASDRALWCARLRDAVRGELPFLTAAAVELATAQAALESGYGAGKAWVRGFNFGNLTTGAQIDQLTATVTRAGITSTLNWPGARWLDVGGDTLDGSAATRITQEWRIYPDLAHAVRDWHALQGVGAYRREGCQALLAAADLVGWAAALRRAGYYGLALDKYTAGLLARRDQVRSLLAGGVA